MAKNLEVKLRKLSQRAGLTLTEGRLLTNMGVNNLPDMINFGDVLSLNYTADLQRSKLREVVSGLSSILHLADTGFEIKFNKAQVKDTADLLAQLADLLAELSQKENSKLGPLDYGVLQTKATSEGEGYYYDDRYDDEEYPNER